MDIPKTITFDKKKAAKRINRLKILGAVATVLGIALFVYYIYAVGPKSVLSGVASIGIEGFAIILGVYFLKLVTRAYAWRLTVYEPYSITVKDTLPAVVIGEALSTVIPLGVLISGTAKAIAIRKKLPLVVGLASVATENLFYSLVTGLLICFGTIAFISRYDLPATFDLIINVVVGLIGAALIFGTVMVLRQWHWVSGICNRIYDRGFFQRSLKNGRLHVRMFENLIYGFYRAHPKRFFPLCGLLVLYHGFGIFEVWFILTKASGFFASAGSAVFLESMSRLVNFVFKLVPFLVGIDEASAEFVVEALGIGAGLGVTLAIVRKGRVIFWSLIGFILIAKRGLSIRDVKRIQEAGIEINPLG